MNICNVLQGMFVRVHIKEEGRWGSERQGVCTAPVFIHAHTFYIRRGVCVLVFFSHAVISTCVSTCVSVWHPIYLWVWYNLPEGHRLIVPPCPSSAITEAFCAHIRPSVPPIPPAALFTHDYSPALTNKPLIFRSLLGTFRDYTTDVHWRFT